MERFEDHIKLHHLKKLMKQFGHHRPTDEMPMDGTFSPGRIIKREPGNVTLGEFKRMLTSMGIDTTEWDTQMELLFAKVDTSADGMVDWNEFCTYMLLHYRENDKVIQKKGIAFVMKPTIRHIPQIKQGMIQGIAVLENPVRYITVSKEGYLCNFDHNLNLDVNHLISEDSQDPRAVPSRRFRAWYTGLVFMGNVNMIAVSSSGMDIKFYDVVAQGFVEVHHLYALQFIPSCLDYWYNVKKPHDESLLLMGSDMGSIHIFYFHKPCQRLFELDGKATTHRAQKIWMPELCVHQEYVRHVKLSNVHTEILRKVKYLPEKNLVISSSGSSHTSVVIADVRSKRRSYIFKRKKGVECYDYSSELNLLLTGGVDHKVLAWNPYIEDKPVAFFLGHQMAIMGVAINSITKHGYSFSKDEVIKVWDLSEYNCLQTVPMKFPSLWHVKQPDFFQAPMILHQNQTLVIGFGDYIAQLKVGKVEELDQSIVVTHKTQLCCAIYNSVFQQVATGADDSSVGVWDVESGQKSFSISEAHGTEEITCMSFSKTGRRLYTGARNGSIKVWNFQNGHNIHQCDSVADSEVTGLVSLGRKKGFLAVGWSRQITFYDDSDSDRFHVKASDDWRGGHLHKDDILSVDFCPPGLLATASFDGEILIWSSETQNLLFRLRKGQPIQVTQKLKAALSMEDSRGSPASVPMVTTIRPNSRHVSSHKTPEGFSQAPVDKLLFLKFRISQGLSDCAVLVSSEAGYLHFWSVYDINHYRGCFYSSNSPDQSVLALASDPENKLLISGDTRGVMFVWDIQEYCLETSSGDENGILSSPQMLFSWTAHKAAVVSLDVVTMSYGTFVLSASTDRTAKLWTVEGHYVGTFGQDDKWNLRDSSTYQHSRDPGMLKEDGEHNPGSFHMFDADNGNVGGVDPPVTMDTTRKASKVNNIDIASSKQSPGQTVKFSTDSIQLNPDAQISQQLPRIKSDVLRLASSTDVTSEDPVRSTSRLNRSADVQDGEEHGQIGSKVKRDVHSAPSVLGRHVERNLARITQSRKQRREMYSQIKNPSGLTYGKQCMPFKALVMPETEEVDFLATLPVSPRMHQQGFFITTENDLQKLTFEDTNSVRFDEKQTKERRKNKKSPNLPDI